MLLTCLAIPWSTGCRSVADVTIVQPFAPPAQRTLELRDGTRGYDLRGDDRMVALLAFPLPGARDGPDDFVIYLDLPRAVGEWRVGGDTGVRGFLIQATGALRGKTTFASGSVTLKSPLLGGQKRTLALEVQTADGATIRGRIAIRPDSIAVREFEQRRSGDVAALGSDGATGLAGDELGRRLIPGAGSTSGTGTDGRASNSP